MQYKERDYPWPRPQPPPPPPPAVQVSGSETPQRIIDLGMKPPPASVTPRSSCLSPACFRGRRRNGGTFHRDYPTVQRGRAQKAPAQPRQNLRPCFSSRFRWSAEGLQLLRCPVIGGPVSSSSDGSGTHNIRHASVTAYSFRLWSLVMVPIQTSISGGADASSQVPNVCFPSLISNLWWLKKCLSSPGLGTCCLAQIDKSDPSEPLS